MEEYAAIITSMEFMRFSPTPHSYELGFVVVRKRIVIASMANRTATPLDLANRHQLLERITEARFTTPDDVDAGFARIANFKTKSIIAILGWSNDLLLPVSEKARSNTIDLFRSRVRPQEYDVTGV